MRTALGYLLAGVLAAALVGGWLWHDQRAGQWATDRARIEGQVAAERAEAQAATRRADSLQRLANAGAALGSVAQRRGDSLRVLADSLAALEALLLAKLPPTPPAACQLYADALAACQARGEALARALDATRTADSLHRAAFVRDSLALLAQAAALAAAERSRDSLEASVRRAPGTCRIPLLGLRCPVVGAGYGVTLGGAVRGGLVLGALVPLVGGR
jgi:hypothetical protein